MTNFYITLRPFCASIVDDAIDDALIFAKINTSSEVTLIFNDRVLEIKATSNKSELLVEYWNL